ncbi:MAG TPA: sigma factor [Steroidobacteraceae bacterium]|nr:sigma factor [Steroidobacteraceae bacterium]
MVSFEGESCHNPACSAVYVRMNDPFQTFESHRQLLFGVAYRMLGSRADAEDILQDAYLRWHSDAAHDIRSPESWLVTTVTRLCIDQLRLARSSRKDASADGESEQRLYSLDAWQETPYYSDRERAALEWTQAVTDLSNGHASDSVYEKVRAHFSEDEIVALTLAIAMINSWNRLNVAFRTEAGGYRPGMFNQLRTA